MENKPIPIFQSIKDTVKTVGISEFELRKRRGAGKLPHIMSGNKVLVNVPALIKLLEKESGVEE